MTHQLFSIAFTPSAQLWSQRIRFSNEREPVYIIERSLLRSLPTEAPEILCYLDPLKEFEKPALQRLRQQYPAALLVGWIAGQQLDHLSCLSLLDSGINAIITDGYSGADIEQAFHDVKTYGYHYNHLIGTALLHQLKKASSTSLLKQLDEREKKAIRLRQQGKTATEIGDELHVSHKTIDKLFWKLYQRTGCRNFLELSNTLQEERHPEFTFY